ncbi:MAG: hypothetical protein EZS28_015167 [Streblomastix strix]|uniref:Uncharacterized protein n=1 Tax=Streblomastix strix TaxID=222440 RepID=A0A5J4W399_9EUKA|nr:MAG: hypothetical protein EZS28_015167 [Streblomastix strix]
MVLEIYLCLVTAGGRGEQKDSGINNGLKYLHELTDAVHQGRNESPLKSQHSIVKRSEEQIEEEGGNEEIDSQLINKGYYRNIMKEAQTAQMKTLRFFIDKSNPRPRWYY